jgi:hypothetical protein
MSPRIGVTKNKVIQMKKYKHGHVCYEYNYITIHITNEAFSLLRKYADEMGQSLVEAASDLIEKQIKKEEVI